MTAYNKNINAHNKHISAYNNWNINVYNNKDKNMNAYNKNINAYNNNKSQGRSPKAHTRTLLGVGPLVYTMYELSGGGYQNMSVDKS